MGSATREALAAARDVLAGLGSVDAATGEQLLSAGRVIADSAPLRSALLDATVEPADRASIVGAVFSGYGDDARALLQAAVSHRWSSSDDLLAGIEELGFRVLARSATSPDVIESELFTFLAAVTSDAELELVISSKLGGAEGRASLVTALVGEKAARETVAILEHVVQQRRGRRIGEIIRSATSVIASENSKTVATVTSATPLPTAQFDRLQKALGAKYGTEILINAVVDPDVLGGMRVTIADDVIDGTVSRRLNDLRLQLAG
jgi:F-type H+-transporting ATPase subunit delta